MSGKETLHPPLQCELCPKECVLEYMKRGDCRVRYNAGDGKLNTLVYAKPCSLHVDPIEKKPMFHFLPGSQAFSLATAGCNLHCVFCQNWEISQTDPEDIDAQDFPPEKVVRAAAANQCQSIAYTYTDPVIYYEYTYDSAKLAKEQGIRNVLVTAGYINEKPLAELLSFVDGSNVDLKAYSEDYYRDVTSGTLKPVLKCLEMHAKAGVILEVTNLIVPTLNDGEQMLKDMCKWMVETLGPDIPLHFSRYYPMYKLTSLPPTPKETLERAAEIALAAGLHFVYVGNVRSEKYETTYCPGCQKALITRKGYEIVTYDLDGDQCKYCGQKIYGLWWPKGQKPPGMKTE